MHFAGGLLSNICPYTHLNSCHKRTPTFYLHCKNLAFLFLDHVFRFFRFWLNNFNNPNFLPQSSINSNFICSCMIQKYFTSQIAKKAAVSVMTAAVSVIFQNDVAVKMPNFKLPLLRLPILPLVTFFIIPLHVIGQIVTTFFLDQRL